MRLFSFLECPENLTSVSFFQIPHPKHGEMCWYCVSKTKMFEIIKVKDGNSSILAGDNVIQDGGLWVCSPIDPLFIILSELENTCKTEDNSYRTIFPEQTFSKELLQIYQLPACNIEHIGQKQIIMGEEAIGLDADKALEWLHLKIAKLQSVMEGEDVLKKSLGLIAEYVQEHIFEALANNYDLSVDEIYRLKRKRKTESIITNSTPRPQPQMSRNIEVQAPRTVKKIVKKSKPPPRGMKSLASYFQKKG